MSYKRIQTLCLSSEIPYKKAKAEIEKIFDDWWDKRFDKQSEDATELMEVLQHIAQHKSRISNYTLDEFLNRMANWGYKVYWAEEKWETAKFEAFKTKLIDFTLTMLKTIKRSKTKTSDNLRAYLFRLIANILSMELRPDFLPILEEAMIVMDTDEQFFALEALKNYFSWEGTTLSKDLITKLDMIVATTKVRSNASNALDVQLHAGVIEQIDAVVAIDDWKDRNRDNW